MLATINSEGNGRVVDHGQLTIVSRHLRHGNKAALQYLGHALCCSHASDWHGNG